MSTRSLNKVMLIGNLTRDPELRYTPAGTPVCTFGMATNRTWTVDGGRKEETEFHRIVAWAKLAELCSKLLYKGRRVFVEGRLQTRQWTGQDNVTRSTTEVVIDDMLLLDSRRDSGTPAGQGGDYDYQDYGYDSSQGGQAGSQFLQDDQTAAPTNQPAPPTDETVTSDIADDQTTSVSDDTQAPPKSKSRGKKSVTPDETISNPADSDQTSPDGETEQADDQPAASDDIPF